MKPDDISNVTIISMTETAARKYEKEPTWSITHLCIIILRSEYCPNGLMRPCNRRVCTRAISSPVRNKNISISQTNRGLGKVGLLLLETNVAQAVSELLHTTPKKEVTNKWRRLHDEELRNLNSPDVIRVTRLRRMSWAGHLARMGRWIKVKVKLSLCFN
jgi:hypothetical protein